MTKSKNANRTQRARPQAQKTVLMEQNANTQRVPAIALENNEEQGPVDENFRPARIAKRIRSARHISSQEDDDPPLIRAHKRPTITQTSTMARPAVIRNEQSNDSNLPDDDREDDDREDDDREDDDREDDDYADDDREDDDREDDDRADDDREDDDREDDDREDDDRKDDREDDYEDVDRSHFEGVSKTTSTRLKVSIVPTNIQVTRNNSSHKKQKTMHA